MLSDWPTTLPSRARCRSRRCADRMDRHHRSPPRSASPPTDQHHDLHGAHGASPLDRGGARDRRRERRKACSARTRARATRIVRGQAPLERCRYEVRCTWPQCTGSIQQQRRDEHRPASRTRSATLSAVPITHAEPGGEPDLAGSQHVALREVLADRRAGERQEHAGPRAPVKMPATVPIAAPDHRPSELAPTRLRAERAAAAKSDHPSSSAVEDRPRPTTIQHRDPREVADPCRDARCPRTRALLPGIAGQHGADHADDDHARRRAPTGRSVMPFDSSGQKGSATHTRWRAAVFTVRAAYAR